MQSIQPIHSPSDSVRRNHQLTLFLLLLLCTCLGASSLEAATRTWTGGHASGANWNLRDNWSGAVVPTHGDTLVFPSGAARIFNTNNIAGLRLAGIQFTGAVGGFNLRGLGVTITNGITLVEGSGNTVSLESLTLGGNQAFHIPSGGGLTVVSDVDLNGFNLSLAAIGDLTMRGAIGGDGNVSKSGVGQLSLSGPKDNTFGGSFTIASGTLAMNKYETISIVPLTQESRISVPGNLILGNGSGTVVATAHFEDQISNTGKVTVASSATLNLNGHDDAVGDLVLSGGEIATGAGTLYLNGDVTAFASSSGSVISGQMALMHNTTFAVSNGTAFVDLDVTADILALTGIIKEGTGTLRLGGTNGYFGTTTVNAGKLHVGNNAALGSPNSGTVVNSGAQMFLESGVSTLREPLTIAGAGFAGVGGALRMGSSMTIATNVVLSGPATIETIGGATELTINGVISGTGPLTKTGTGTLVLAGNSANTFSGGLFAREGLLLLSKLVGSAVQGDLVIGTTNTTGTVRHTRSANLGGAVTVNSGSVYDLDGFNESVDNLTFIGGGAVRTDSGLLTVDSDVIVRGMPFEVVDNATITGRLRLGSVGTAHVTVLPAGDSSPDYVQLIVSAQVSGPAAIIKDGTGLAGLIGSNTFSGPLTVERGSLNIWNDHALGTPAGDTFVENDGMLTLLGDITVEEEQLHLNSTNTSGLFGGALLSVFGTNTWTGPIVLGTTAMVHVTTNTALDLTGAISGGGGLTKVGPGMLRYSGTAMNTYLGATLVSEGTLRLERGGGVNRALPSALVVGDGVGGPEADVVEAVAPSQINNLAPVTINASGALRVLGDDIIGSLSGSGHLDLEGALVELQTGENDASTAFTGLISGTGGLRKRGDGTFTINGTNTYSGTTVVAEGTLIINSKQPASDVIVLEGATLSGNGEAGNATVRGTLAPGSPYGYLKAASFDFDTESHLALEINGPSSNTGYDSIYTLGSMDLTGAALDVSLGWAPYAGQTFIIGGYNALAGQFDGLPDGSIITLNQIPLQLDYEASPAKQITLTVGDLALRLSGTRIEGGNGNGRLEPDECNDIFVAIENPTAGAVNILEAYLESTSPTRVAVTRSEGVYGAVPAGGSRTNRMAFQIRTSPSFACGYPTWFHLVVNTEAHGRFAILFSLPSGVPGSLRAYPSVLTPAAIPDAGALSSQLPVTDDFAVARARVSLHATHPSVGQLRFRLIPPIGPEIVLAANEGGAGDDYGTSCSRRTVFDDSAPMNITAAAAPFSGTFAPEGNLADLIGLRSAGVWTLLVEDTVAGAVGTLQCWTLELAPAECAPGGGGCESCLATVSGALDGTSPMMPNHLNFTAYETGCGNADPCPGLSFSGTAPFRYGTHAFTNAGPDACVTVVLNVPCTNASGALRVSAYLGDFNPGDLCQNLIGFTGFGASGGLAGCSFRVPAGQRFIVVVNEDNYDGPSQGCGNYSLELYGLPCPQAAPTLHIANDAGPDKVRLHWSTAYPGFQLQGKPSLGGPGIVSPTYTNVTTALTVHGGQYSVTNSASGSSGFFRLRKP